MMTRFMIASKTRPGIDLESLVAKHELSVDSKSMFTTDGMGGGATQLVPITPWNLRSALALIGNKGFFPFRGFFDGFNCCVLIYNDKYIT